MFHTNNGFWNRHQGRINWGIVALSVLFVACSIGEANPTTVATTLAADTTTTAVATTRASDTTTTAQLPAPTELSGRWSANVGLEPTELKLDGASYSITFGPDTVSADIMVEGDTITFINKGYVTCHGEGRGMYRWSIEDDILKFEPLGEDECPNRGSILRNAEYTLVDPLD